MNVGLSLSSVLLVAFLSYGVFSAWQLASFWFPNECSESDKVCFRPYFDSASQYDFHLFEAVKQNGTSKSLSRYAVPKNATPIWSKHRIFLQQEFTHNFQTPDFSRVRQNGSMMLLALLAPAGTTLDNLPRLETIEDFLKSLACLLKLTRKKPITTREGKYLLSADSSRTENELHYMNMSRPSPHIKPVLKVRFVVDTRRYGSESRPLDIPFNFVVANAYKNHFYEDEMHFLSHHWIPVSSNCSFPDPNITIKYIPTSIGSFRMLQVLKEAIQFLKKYGLGENELNQVLMILSPDHLYRLVLTYTISMLHILLSALAFKNEVGFYRRLKNTYGISKRSLVGHAVCSLITFLFLIDSPGTSWLVLGSVGAGVVVDCWKLVRLFSLAGGQSKSPQEQIAESQSESHDIEGMYHLSLVLYPLVIIYSIYSLYSEPHRSWWSWFIRSAVNGVYAFGFLLMVPQVFLNYKLKTVAHLPWRSMTYKVFNTFVDDVFAWMIEMPTMHRLATLRDDVVFFVYLYQRWIYPVDKQRVNEFGYAAAVEGNSEIEDAKTVD